MQRKVVRLARQFCKNILRPRCCYKMLAPTVQFHQENLHVLFEADRNLKINLPSKPIAATVESKIILPEIQSNATVI